MGEVGETRQGLDSKENVLPGRVQSYIIKYLWHIMYNIHNLYIYECIIFDLNTL